MIQYDKEPDSLDMVLHCSYCFEITEPVFILSVCEFNKFVFDLQALFIISEDNRQTVVYPHMLLVSAGSQASHTVTKVTEAVCFTKTVSVKRAV